MAPRYDEAPELAAPAETLPEVYHPHEAAEASPYVNNKHPFRSTTPTQAVVTSPSPVSTDPSGGSHHHHQYHHDSYQHHHQQQQQTYYSPHDLHINDTHNTATASTAAINSPTTSITPTSTTHNHHQQHHQDPKLGITTTATSATALSQDIINNNSHPTTRSWRRRKTILGCAPPVFVLACLVALLSLAVVGLSAGIGMVARRAREAEAEAIAAAATAEEEGEKGGGGEGGGGEEEITAGVSATSTDFSSIDKGCSGEESEEVMGSEYTSSFYDQSTYTVYCNSDLVSATPFYSLFVGTFDDCMDACAAWSDYVPSAFPEQSSSEGEGEEGSENKNATCAGVTFIPIWTVRSVAVEGGAPGNCYLKPGPLDVDDLTDPNIGQYVHAALRSG